MLILPGFVVENNGRSATKPPPVRTSHAVRGSESWSTGAQQVPTHMTNHEILQKIPTILGVLLLFCTFHCLWKTRRRIMMRHAMGITCIFFPEETGPDLKATEVNVHVTFPASGTIPQLRTSQLTQAPCTKKCPFPSFILMHLCTGMGLPS